MAKNVVLDELHITLHRPSDITDTRIEEIRRTLSGDAFMTRLQRALRAVIRVYPELAGVRVSLSR